jgi:hypothetical protein
VIVGADAAASLPTWGAGRRGCARGGESCSSTRRASGEPPTDWTFEQVSIPRLGGEAEALICGCRRCTIP